MPMPDPKVKTDIYKRDPSKEYTEYEENRANAFFEIMSDSPNKTTAIKVKHLRTSSKPGAKENSSDDPNSHSFLKVKFDGDEQDSVLAVDIHKLGQGAFGRVKLAVDREHGNKLHVVKMQKCFDDNEAVKDQIKREVDFLKQSGAKVAYFTRRSKSKAYNPSTGQDEYYIKHYMVSEYQGQELESYLTENKSNLSKDNQLDLAIKLFLEIDNLHKKGIAHRDIKPSNFVVQTVDGRLKLKAIDFGFAEDINKKSTKAKGTPLYVPSNIKNESNRILDLYAGLRVVGFEKKFFNYIILRSPSLLQHNGTADQCPRDHLDPSEVWILQNDLIDQNSQVKKILSYAMHDKSTLPFNIHADDIACCFVLIRNNIYTKENLVNLSKISNLKSEIINQYQINPESINQNFINNISSKYSKDYDKYNLAFEMLGNKKGKNLTVPFIFHKKDIKVPCATIDHTAN